ncbi:MAG TPA: nucleoside-diphosphate sugar epimerase/dehydratase [Burkholderiales bacterium]|nr:nucleoside-diphosphate sugar epimerase/dehydratase [Burkholderiales bacterium]
MKADWRTLLAFVHDIAACAAAWLCAYWLRFTPEIPDNYLHQAFTTLLWVVPVHAILFWGFGLYRGLWRYASLPDLRRILMAVGTAAIAVPTLMFMLQIAVPRSVLIMTPILLMLVMGGSRIAFRAWKERMLTGLMAAQREPVLVLGAEEAAVTLIKELARSPQWRVVGVLDDDEAKIGLQLHGVNVLGRLNEIPRWQRRLGVAQAIVAMPEATHTARRRVVEFCNHAGIRVLTVPSYDDLVSGRVTVSQVRHVELDDLLGRDPVQLDTVGLRGWLAGRVVMVTGAGGSIGSELARQIARFEPRQLVMFEQNEFALYTIEQKFAASHPRMPAAYAIGDVKDAERIEHVIRTHNPSVIFHAAAYKHVPLMEKENAWQALLNNVAGTHVIARAAAAGGVEKFVFVSSDKAVNPTSVMGASKRLAEMVCQALQRPEGTRFVMVRFGNVLGSTGSVIPRFREQIAQGGPVTVTHPDITRYFMSIPEAAQLVLQAGLMGKGGEIFALDMGEPVRIVDLARDMIRLSGLTEDDIKIVFTGLRPGEKLFEEVLADGEQSLATPHPKVRIARARKVDDGWLDALIAWLQQTGAPEDREVRSALARWVPEYGSSQTRRESVSRTAVSE